MNAKISDTSTDGQSVSSETAGVSHAPLPWSARHVGDSNVVGAIFEILDRNGRKVAEYVLERDAIRILRALNSHDDLLASCRAALAESVGQPSRRVGPQAVDALRAAILKATGGAS